MTEKMKPSGIACIGDIPSNWQVKRLKYACRKITDGSHFSPETVDEGKIYITVSDLYENAIHTDTAKRIAPSDFAELVKNGCQPNPGDVLLSKDGTVGRSAIVSRNNDYVVLSSIGILTPGPRLSSHYLKYNLDGSHLQEQMLRAMDGSALKRITISKIAEFFAVIPPIEEQNAIADFLDNQCAKIDSVITDIEKQIETLHKYKKSLITETVTKGLDRSGPMKDSGVKWIGEIPADWTVSRVKYLIDDNHPYPIGDGDHGMIKADDYLDEGIPYIRVLNLTWGDGMNLDNLVFISDKMNTMIKNSELRPNDILIAKTGATIGKTAIVPESLPISNTTSHVGKITLPNTHCAKYFFYVMTSNVVQKQIQDISAMQSTRPELGIEGMRDLIVVVPPLNTQEHIAEYLDERCAKTEAILQTKKTQLEVMKKHKASIIYEYVTGKKRVTEVN